MKIIDGLSYDDVLLIPKYSRIRSRSDVDLSVTIKDYKFNLPFLPSNMVSISELSMMKLMYENKSLGLFHRFAEFTTQLKWLQEIKTWGDDAVKYIGFSIGIKDEDCSKVTQLVEEGAKIICIDVAHGDSDRCLSMTSWIKNNHPNILLISGNVAMGDGATRIWEAGADICKISIGSGSICTTRIATGNGVPSITTLDSCHEAKNQATKQLNRPLFLMNDGGCKIVGDVVKSLCFADIVMLGNIFAGTDEAAGEIVEHNGTKYKKYVGSSTHRGSHKEGVEGLKKCKGPAAQVIQQLTEGIRSGMSYQNSRNLEELRRDPHFVKISSAGLTESHAHDLDIITG